MLLSTPKFESLVLAGGQQSSDYILFKEDLLLSASSGLIFLAHLRAAWY